MRTYYESISGTKSPHYCRVKPSLVPDSHNSKILENLEHILILKALLNPNWAERLEAMHSIAEIQDSNDEIEVGLQPRECIAAFNRIDGRIILESTKHYLPVKKVMKFRLVSKDFRTVIDVSPTIKDRLVYHLNGSSSTLEACQTAQGQIVVPLRTLLKSTFGWVHLKFSNVELGSNLFRQNDVLTKFKTTCHNLKSITFDNVNIEMGQFIEIIAFCPKLEEIRIFNSPSMFTSGYSIFKFQPFMAAFQDRLANLKSFAMHDNRINTSVMTLPTLQGWTSGMSNLVVLDLQVPPAGNGALPITHLAEVLDRSKNTLRHVGLVGKCGFDGTIQAVLRELDLTSLCLGGTRFQQSEILARILKYFKNLEILSLFEIEIHSYTMWIIGKTLHKLQKLSLKDVTFTGDTQLDAISNNPTITDLTLHASGLEQDQVDWLRVVQVHPKFILTSLSLRFRNAYHFLKPCILASLKCLMIFGIEMVSNEEFGDDSMEILVRKVMRMSHLEKLGIIGLSLKDSDFPELVSRHLGPGCGQQPRSFSNLTKLRYLDLSKCMIGDYTLMGHLLDLPSLEVLDISETQVTQWGIWSVVNMRREDAEVWKNIEEIYAKNCQNLNINLNGVKEIENILNAKFICDPVKDKVKYSDSLYGDGEEEDSPNLEEEVF